MGRPGEINSFHVSAAVGVQRFFLTLYARVMSMVGSNETVSLAWGKILMGVGVLIFGTSSVLGGGPLWQLVTAAAAVAFGLVLVITGLRSLVARRREQLKARDEDLGRD
ncbi:hypothetical protein JF66_19895 [Cryobacterium sp. MLB-32]|nr:hypothetical protein JF66_19895 [Cryobacterium sp. MLB-32]